jgi:Fe-S-cluster containining protein
MGEAKLKRRRQEDIEQGKTIQVPDLITGEPRPGRLSPSVDALIQDFEARSIRLVRGERDVAAKVPCDGCTACCRSGELLPVGTDEDVSALSLTPPDYATGLRYLRRNPDGTCVHLGADGCQVHPHRPLVCRFFDCRLAAAFGITPKPAAGHPYPSWAPVTDTRVDWALSGIAQTIGLETIKEVQQAGETWSISSLLPQLIERYLELRPGFFRIHQRLGSFLERLSPAARQEVGKQLNERLGISDPFDHMRRLAREIEASQTHHPEGEQ